MPATPAWLALVESVFNRRIGQSRTAAELAQRLSQTSLVIEIEGLLLIRAAVSAGRLALKSERAAGGTGAAVERGEAADATISGTPLALLELFAAGSRSTGSAKLNRALIRGDAQVAARYRELIAAARPDFEEELSRWVGDLPARRLALGAQGAFAFLRKLGRTAQENLAEYLQEESRDLPSKAELEDFALGVDQLREIADRVAVRLTRVEARLAQAGSKGA